MEKVSIVIPFYNVEEHIDKCLESVINQTYNNIEIICVNDGSTDNCQKIVESYMKNDDRIILFDQHNEGVFEARRKGLQTATGKYICFIDSDDWIESTYIETMLSNVDEHDMIACAAYKDSKEGESLNCIVEAFAIGVYDVRKQLLESFIFDETTNQLQRINGYLWNKLFFTHKMKEVYLKIGKCNLRYSEDALITYLYILQCKTIKIIDNKLYHYVQRDNSVCNTVSLSRLSDAETLYTIMKENIDFEIQKDVIPQVEYWIRRIIGYTLNNNIQFTQKDILSQYIYDIACLKNKKIVIYGAGKAGKDLVKQLSYGNYQVVGWVDQDYANINNPNIIDPKMINYIQHDVVVIAASSELLAKNMKESVKNIRNCDEIIWIKPEILF